MSEKRLFMRNIKSRCERYAVRSDEVGEIRLHFGFAKITNRAVVDSHSTTLARRWTRRRSRRDSFAFWLRQNHESSGCGLPFYIGAAVDATAE